MLNIISSPLLITFAGNQLPLVVEAGAAWSGHSTGSPWGYEINFGVDEVPAATNITITMYGVPHIIQVMPTGTTLSDSGLEVEENPTGGALIAAWIMTNLLPIIAANYHLAQCTFTQAGNILLINAPYESFLTVTTDIPSAVATAVGTGTPETFPENYNILAEVYITHPLGTTERKAASLKAVPEKDSPYYAKFDLAPVVKSYLRRTLPSYNQTAISIAQQGIGRVRLVVTEGYGNPLQYKKTDEPAQFLAVYGSVPFQHFPTVGNLYIGTAAAYPLSWKPQKTIASKSQQEYMLFLPIYASVASTITCDIKGTIKYTDGTSSNVYYITGYVFSKLTQYLIPCGYTQLNVGNFNTAKTVLSWTVEVVDGSNTFPNIKREYTLEPKCNESRSKYFLFGNSLGGFDTLRTTTNYTVGIKVEKEIFQSLLGLDYTSKAGEFSTYNINASKRIQTNTGWLTLEEIKWLHDFIVSDEVYEMIEGKFLPINPLLQSVQLYTNEERLYSLSFEYEYRFNANSFAQENLIHL
jgi:hypothetical protein